MVLNKTQAKILATGLGFNRTRSRTRPSASLVFFLGFVLGSLLTAAFNLFF